MKINYAKNLSKEFSLTNHFESFKRNIKATNFNVKIINILQRTTTKTLTAVGKIVGRVVKPSVLRR